MLVSEKLQKWIDENPNGHLEKSCKKIGVEINASEMSVSRHINNLVAARDNRLPSEVAAERKAAGFCQGSKKLSDEQIAQIRKYADQGDTLIDICFKTKHDKRTVEKYLQTS